MNADSCMTSECRGQNSDSSIVSVVSFPLVGEEDAVAEYITAIARGSGPCS